jgi:hypothetical protein
MNTDGPGRVKAFATALASVAGVASSSPVRIVILPVCPCRDSEAFETRLRTIWLICEESP